jgi:hypothetical protein
MYVAACRAITNLLETFDTKGALLEMHGREILKYTLAIVQRLHDWQPELSPASPKTIGHQMTSLGLVGPKGLVQALAQLTHPCD